MILQGNWAHDRVLVRALFGHFASCSLRGARKCPNPVGPYIFQRPRGKIKIVQLFLAALIIQLSSDCKDTTQTSNSIDPNQHQTFFCLFHFKVFSQIKENKNYVLACKNVSFLEFHKHFSTVWQFNPFVAIILKSFLGANLTYVF